MPGEVDNQISPSKQLTRLQVYIQQSKIKLEKYSFVEKDCTYDFETKLSQIHGISTHEAKVWMEAYIDYMIYASFLITQNLLTDESKKYLCFVPRAISSVWRLHILYSLNYLEFCELLLSSKCLIHYAPTKYSLLPNLDLKSLRMNYENKKRALFKNGRCNNSLLSVWEPFNHAFFNNELVHYLPIEAYKNSLKELSQLYSEKNMSTMKPYLIKRTTCLLRKFWKLDDIFNSSFSDKKSWKLKDSFLDFSNLDDKLKTIAERIDEIKLPDPFIKCLMLENHKTKDEAIDMICEYAKFLFLAYITNGQICPSEEVDQVWHLHMQFTKQYVINVKETFGYVMPHFPSKGKVK
jgi:hypothetical protein